MFSQPPSLCSFPARRHGDKWEGVPLVGDSSTQRGLSAITTSVCLRYGLFVVLPSTYSFIITLKIYGAGKTDCAAVLKLCAYHISPF